MKRILILGTSPIWNNVDASPIVYDFNDETNNRHFSNHTIDTVYDETDPRNLYFGLQQIDLLVNSNPTLPLMENLEIHAARTNTENRASLTDGSMSIYSTGYGEDYTGFNVKLTRNPTNYNLVLSYSKVNNDLSLFEPTINTPLTFNTETLNPHELLKSFRIDGIPFHKFINMEINTTRKIVETKDIYVGNIKYITIPYIHDEYISAVNNVKLNCVEQIITKSNVITLKQSNSVIENITVQKLTSDISLNSDEYIDIPYKVAGFDINVPGESRRPNIICSTDNPNITLDTTLFPTIKISSSVKNQQFTLHIETTEEFELKDIDGQTYNFKDNKYIFDGTDTFELLNTGINYEFEMIVEYTSIQNTFMCYGNMTNRATLIVTDFDTEYDFYMKLIENYYDITNPITESEYNVLLDQILSDPNMYAKMGLDISDLQTTLDFTNDWLIKSCNITILTRDSSISSFFKNANSTVIGVANGIPTSVPCVRIFLDSTMSVVSADVNMTTYSSMCSTDSNLELEKNILNPDNYDCEYITDIINYWDEYDMTTYVEHNKITDLIILGAYIDNSPLTILTKKYVVYLPIGVDFHLPDYVKTVDPSTILSTSLDEVDYSISEVGGDIPYQYRIDYLGEGFPDVGLNMNLILTIQTEYNYDYYSLCDSLYELDTETIIPFDIKLEYQPVSFTEVNKEAEYNAQIKYLTTQSLKLAYAKNITTCAAFDLVYAAYNTRIGSSAVLSVILEAVASLETKSKRSYSISELFPGIFETSLKYDMSESVRSDISESALELYMFDSSSNYRCIVANNKHPVKTLRQTLYKTALKSIVSDIFNYTGRYVGEYVDGNLVAMEIEVALKQKYSGIVSEITFVFSDYAGSLFEELNFELSVTFLNTTTELIVPVSI